MDLEVIRESETRFRSYVDALSSVIGHADRKRPLEDYCVGLMGPSERKSVEPIAAVTAPGRTAAQHQSLLHFVGEFNWSDEKVLAKVREMVLPAIERHGAIEAWIIDDTGFPKKGMHSVGVASQYCGQLGREGNCQVAVSLSVANHHASLPVAYRLYLPREWTKDRKRCRKAAVPATVHFTTKQQIALAHINAALAAGVPRGVVLIDADYGRDGNLRQELRSLELTYVAAIQSSPLAWRPGSGPKTDRRLPITRREDPDLMSIKELALSLGESTWKTIRWREGSADWLEFALRARAGPLGSRRRTMAVDRVASRRESANQVLAVQSSRGHSLQRAGRHRQAALAHRARLSGTQAGGRARALRRTRMARLPPPRDAVHRRLRVSDLRTGDDSPLGTTSRPAVLATCRSRRSQIPRSRRCGLSDMSPIPSQPCADVLPQHSPNVCRDVLVAAASKSGSDVYDAVV